MSGQRFIITTLILFMALGTPFLISQPTALASAGLSLGFSAPLAHASMLVVLALVGFAAALLPHDGLILMPIAFTLMLMVGGVLKLDLMHEEELHYFILGAILSMSLLVAVTQDKLTVMTLLILASLGFHLGGFYMSAVPDIANPTYYLFGVLFSLGMLLAISVAFGITLLGDNEEAWQRLRESPRFAFIRRLFL